ncbi:MULTISPECIES: hypothetical protein [Bradyrhizobium]|uniref:hypothetical protein n=1 Tax=Bradyrhizobium TaxID=374 RepID=UPI002867DA7F|nr:MULTISPECIES: hypothetical protein [Bradyrhizobium]
MIVVGVILLFPGLCALAFGAGGGRDPMVIMIVLVCLLVSAGGIWLIAAAIGGRNAKRPPAGP